MEEEWGFAISMFLLMSEMALHAYVFTDWLYMVIFAVAFLAYLQYHLLRNVHVNRAYFATRAARHQAALVGAMVLFLVVFAVVPRLVAHVVVRVFVHVGAAKGFMWAAKHCHTMIHHVSAEREYNQHINST